MSTSERPRFTKLGEIVGESEESAFRSVRGEVCEDPSDKENSRRVEHQHQTAAPSKVKNLRNKFEAIREEGGEDNSISLDTNSASGDTRLHPLERTGSTIVGKAAGTAAGPAGASHDLNTTGKSSSRKDGDSTTPEWIRELKKRTSNAGGSRPVDRNKKMSSSSAGLPPEGADTSGGGGMESAAGVNSSQRTSVKSLDSEVPTSVPAVSSTNSYQQSSAAQAGRTQKQTAVVGGDAGTEVEEQCFRWNEQMQWTSYKNPRKLPDLLGRFTAEATNFSKRFVCHMSYSQPDKEISQSRIADAGP